MNLINKRLLSQKIQSFEFPTGEKRVLSQKLIENWQKALKDSDLEKTKEKSVQGKFLNTFFEEILGYTDVTIGQDEWTLIQHPRIENDSMEPDGSLGWFTKDHKLTRVVIELKDAKTSLDKKQISRVGKYTPIEQAYVYSTKYEGCNWIIVSNFKEIRLYNKQRTQEYYEKFDVLNFNDETEFKRFYFLISKENLISKDKESIVDILAKDTTAEEQNITKKFYIEFKKIRTDLLDHLINQNPQIEKTILLEKTQKLLDRLIFTLVCEDTSSLLPLNIIKNTYERAINSLSPSDQRVWTEFKGLFLAIDKGNIRVKPPINAYNGGLFAFDNILDSLEIKDDIWQELMGLADYDFETDLNVNILGHIFEQSISDLELIKESITLLKEDGGHLLTEGGNRIEIGIEEKMVEKVGKRKKDGIFYTPEYITRYIVENTVGRYLEEHPEKLETLKILDPACGSGAFLNQAHSFLFKEHRNRYETKINEKIEKGEKITLFDYNSAETDRGILLNNLYGVDLNQESVDITKLALWLKTARKSEPLQSLDKNIKCGNSLINDNLIVGDKAFDWEKEYEEIVRNGGFDVIIGNPPYVNGIILQESKPIEREWLRNNYSTLIEKWDLYIAFIEKGLTLLKENGYLSFIIPDAFMTEKYASKLQQYIANNVRVVQIDYFPNIYIFQNVGVHNVILTIQKIKPTFPIKKVKHEDLFGNYVTKEIEDKEEIFLDYDYQRFDFDQNKFYKLGDICFISKGMVLNADEKKYKGEFIKKDLLSKKETNINNKKIIEGEDVSAFNITNFKWVEWNTERVPKQISRPTFPELHTNNKLVTNKVGMLKVAFDEEGFACDQTVRVLIKWNQLVDINNKSISGSVEKYSNFKRDELEKISNNYGYQFLLALLNSKLIKNIFYNLRGLRSIDINPLVLRKIPVPVITSNQQHTISSASIQIIKLSDELYKKTNTSLELLNVKYNPKTISMVLRLFYRLGFNEFIFELEKQKVKLNLTQQDELQQWFDKKRSELLDLDNKIRTLGKEIDQEVYRLYGLTEKEIKIIESK